MIQRTESRNVVLTLDGKPLLVCGRFVLKLLRVHRGKAMVEVVDTNPPPDLVADAIELPEDKRVK